MSVVGMAVRGLPSILRLLCLAVCVSLSALLAQNGVFAQDMDDHSDVLSNGTAITAGTPVAGVMNSGTDVDAFSFSIASTLDVWVYTTGSLDTGANCSTAMRPQLRPAWTAPFLQKGITSTSQRTWKRVHTTWPFPARVGPPAPTPFI